MSEVVRVLVLLPSDPFSERVGGIHTFVKGFVKYAPDDFAIEMLGASSDLDTRPLGAWRDVELDGGPLRYLPIIHTPHVNRRELVPRALRFAFALRRRRSWYASDGRIFQVHRAGIPLALTRRQRPRIQVVHLNAADIYAERGESRWRLLPGLYHRVEAMTLPSMDRIFVVNEQGLEFYRRRHPAQAERMAFLPTWVDDEMFHPPASEAETAGTRQELAAGGGPPTQTPLLVFAGRLELQKDPMLALTAFGTLRTSGRQAHLLVAGDGSMAERFDDEVARLGLRDHVTRVGAISRPELARILRAADGFVLSSAFEGMPIAVLEALASGLPVAATGVGEVPRLVVDGRSGQLAADRSPAALADAVATVLGRPRAAWNEGTRAAAEPYRARTVLAGFYEAHRQVAATQQRAKA